MTETQYLLVIGFTILFSGLFSGSEIAFVTANRLKVEVKRRQKRAGASLASQLISKPENFLTTTLVGNNLINVLYSTAMAFFLAGVLGLESIILQTIISTFILLYFGEIIPKMIAREFADVLVTRLGYFLRACYVLLYPLIVLSRTVSLFMVQLIGFKEATFKQMFSVHDVEEILEEGRMTGTIDPDESELIENVFEMKDQRVREIMIPRTDISALDIQSSMKECVEYFNETGYSRIPVYDGSIDNISGIVHARDLFRSPSSLSEIIRPVMYVPEFKKSAELLKEFQQQGVSVAIVIDEFGGTAGLLTMEDLLEELVGDIQDEYDREETTLKEIEPGVFLVSGRILVSELNEKVDFGIEEGDYETVAGYVVHQLGRIPAPREKVELEKLSIDILKATRNRIDLMKFRKRGDDEENA